MKTVHVNITLEDAEYEMLKEFLADSGRTLRNFFEKYTKKFISREKKKQEYADKLFYSESNMKALEESFRQYERGEVIVKTMAELRAMENA